MRDFVQPAEVNAGAMVASGGASITCVVAVSGGGLRLTRANGADEVVLLEVALDRTADVAGISHSAVSLKVDHSTLIVDFAATQHEKQSRRSGTARLTAARQRRAKRRFVAAMTGSSAARTAHVPIAPIGRGSWGSTARASPNRATDAGIFFTHIHSPRITRHFRRLMKETESLVDWRFVYNPKHASRSVTEIGQPPVLGGRYQQMELRGGRLQGFLDVALIPRVLATQARRVWVMEYDVDYAGCWAEFFAQFADNDCDLLTSSLAPRSETPGWVHWHIAGAPTWVQERQFYRCFHPLMRLSRGFALTYGVMLADAGWEGHSEFTLATAAAASKATVEDFGGDGPLTPRSRLRRNYVNDPSDPDLIPGTFIWRPARRHYFHEQPEAFPQPKKLYHPIKPWEDG